MIPSKRIKEIFVKRAKIDTRDTLMIASNVEIAIIDYLDEQYDITNSTIPMMKGTIPAKKAKAIAKAKKVKKVVKNKKK